MKILITGTLGHIGSYIIENIHKNKKIKKVYLVDNFSNQKFNILFKIRNIKYKFIYGDLTQKKFCLKLPKADTVIHLASITNAEKSFEIKKKIFTNNLGCFQNILDYCIKNKSKLIHISSTSVYGSKKGFINEATNVSPQSPYAEIKV